MIPLVLAQKFLSWRTVLELMLLSTNRVGLESLTESSLFAINNSLVFYEAAMFLTAPKRNEKRNRDRKLVQEN